MPLKNKNRSLSSHTRLLMTEDTTRKKLMMNKSNTIHVKLPKLVLHENSSSSSSSRSSNDGYSSTSLLNDEVTKLVDIPSPIKVRKKKLFYHQVRIIISLIHLVKFLSKRPSLMDSLKEEEDVSELVHKTFVPLNDAYDNLVFNKDYFKTKKITEMSKEVRNLLTLIPESRTEDQIKLIRIGMQRIKSYYEYPLNMQEKIAQCAMYQKIPPKHVIIRQGQIAESFYFIINGQAIVTILEENERTGEMRNRVASVLKPGQSFGELAFLYNSTRTATVTSLNDMELVSIGREDFMKIFVPKNGEMPDHIKFLSNLQFMKNWPIEKLIQNPEECLFHYYKSDQIILSNIKKCEWIYVIKSGQCQVIRKIPFSKPKSIYKLPMTKSVLEFLDDKKSKVNSGLKLNSPSIYSRPTNSQYNNMDGRKSKTGSALKSATYSTVSVGQWTKSGAVNSCLSGFSTSPKYTYVQIQKLKAGDTFGLNKLNFHDGFDINMNNNKNDELNDEIGLLSNGAEIIMISKSTYEKYANNLVKNTIRTKVDQLPNSKDLETELKVLNGWKYYKTRVLTDAYKYKTTYNDQV